MTSGDEAADGGMTADRLADCRERIDGIAERPFDEQAATLEFVHESLTAELDELLQRDRDDDAPSSSSGARSVQADRAEDAPR